MKNLIFGVALVAFVGCAGPQSGYLNPEDDVFGRASRMEYTQKHRSIVDVVERLLTDPLFTAKYDYALKRAADRGRVVPTIAIQPIENNTGDGRSDTTATGQMYRELITAIRKTGKFEIIDYARRAQMMNAAVSAANAGERPDNVQHIGDYASADFIMTGELRRESTEDRRANVYHHFLNLEMTDTAAGTVFWSDTATPTVKFSTERR